MLKKTNRDTVGMTLVDDMYLVSSYVATFFGRKFPTKSHPVYAFIGHNDKTQISISYTGKYVDVRIGEYHVKINEIILRYNSNGDPVINLQASKTVPREMVDIIQWAESDQEREQVHVSEYWHALPRVRCVYEPFSRPVTRAAGRR